MRSKEQTLAMRKKSLGLSLSLAYNEPLKIVRGKGQYLYDEKGREYLDCVNNISHVGHCHPAVIQAAHEQNQLLNTNTRYLHDNIIELAEKLQQNALGVGNYLLSGLNILKEKFEFIGDVRGKGLFIGLELVENRKTLDPAPEKAKEIINKMKEIRILISTDGPFNNVLKIKPPMVFSRENAQQIIQSLEENLSGI